MNKLTQQEAAKVLAEALRLESLYKKSGSRLGQSIHWACNDESRLDAELKCKLMQLLDSSYATDDDFYHEIDEVFVTNKFYELYVEQY